MPAKNPTHVFIDTNAYLSFFAFTKDDLGQLSKVKEAVADGRLVLHLPQQVVDEFNRNREAKITEAVKAFTQSVSVGSYPRLLESYPEIKDFVAAGKALQKSRDSLVASAMKDAESRQHPADKLFTDIRGAAAVYPITDEVYSRGVRRHILRNPPGKKDSYGDQINWECLLEKVPNGKDLHVVARDSDWDSPLGGGRPLQFLVDEWKSRKGASLFLHNEVRIFLQQFAQIEFNGLKKEKDAAVQALVNSLSFATTHAAVSKLHGYLHLLEPQDVVALAESATKNSQVSWIMTDADVRAFYTALLAFKSKDLPPELEYEVSKLAGLSPEDPEDDPEEHPGADPDDDPGFPPGVPPH